MVVETQAYALLVKKRAAVDATGVFRRVERLSGAHGSTGLLYLESAGDPFTVAPENASYRARADAFLAPILLSPPYSAEALGRPT